LQSFDFSTLYTEIGLVDLKAHIRVLINKVVIGCRSFIILIF
jgi:hypothetical protein